MKVIISLNGTEVWRCVGGQCDIYHAAWEYMKLQAEPGSFKVALLEGRKGEGGEEHEMVVFCMSGDEYIKYADIMGHGSRLGAALKDTGFTVADIERAWAEYEVVLLRSETKSTG